jgi:hypothetical protein
MGRPKGSKNKVAEPSAEGSLDGKMTGRTPAPEVKEPVKVAPGGRKPTGHPIWTPSPDMGSIKPPPDAEAVCASCTSDCREPRKKWHYGPDQRTWCNLCNCQAWSA